MEQEHSITILVVDDIKANLIAMQEVLISAGYLVITALSGQEALSIALKQYLDLILLDVQMPGMDGFEVAELLKSNKITQEIPFIFITAISKESHYVDRGYKLGADNYIFKPINAEDLLGKINVSLRYHQYKKQMQIYDQRKHESKKKHSG